MVWTDEQQAIINHDAGHAKVSAVAGSGKSATLVERVARLLESGVSSKRLQVVMFNASASSGFTHRLRARLKDSNQPMPEVRTFHSLGMRLCKILSERGHIPNWRLETQDWVESRMASEALEAVIGERPQKDDVEPFLDFIGLVKSDIISADDMFPEATEITGKPMPDHFVEAYEKFEEMRASAGVRFFSDLIHDPVMHLLEHDELAAWVGNRLDHLLVDEYQDVNEVQQALITIIAGSSASVMVVGDVDQCIYEWRGARPEYIQTLFDADFPDATTYRLSYTFRYGHRVSLLANHVISNNSRRDDKLCLSHVTTPDTRIALTAEDAPAHPAVEALRNWVDSGRSLSESAVLVRLYGMAVPVELALLKDRIPYRLDGRESVFHRKEARMLFGYLRLAAGRLSLPSPDGGSAADYIEAMLTTPMVGVQRQAMGRLVERVAHQPDAVRQIIDSALQMGEVQDWQSRKLRARITLWERVAAFTQEAPAKDVLSLVFDTLKLNVTLMRESVREETGRDRLEVCRSLMEFVGSMSVGEVLAETDELMSEAANSAFDSRASAVTITSVHKAKGLEWPLVIIPGLREGGLPTENAEDDGPRTEAERRLCYVAITRAQEQLLLLHPEDTDLALHNQYGMQGPLEGGKPIASRFLYEANVRLSDQVGGLLGRGDTNEVIEGVDIKMCQEYLGRLEQTVSLNAIDPPKRAGGLVCGPNTPCRAVTGMKVRHTQFGKGEVVDVITRAGKISLRVRFARGAERIIIAHQAELEEDVSEAA